MGGAILGTAGSDMRSGDENQWNVARLALGFVGDEVGFALAGSGAIREHGLVNRPTQDVDSFTVENDLERFSSSVDKVVSTLREAGYDVEIWRSEGVPRARGDEPSINWLNN